MTVFNVEINSIEVTELLARLSLSWDTRSMLLWMQNDVTEFFHTDIESRFNEEGDVKTGFWPPLTETTQRIREQLGYGPEPINRRTDKMFDFLMGAYPIYWGEGWIQMHIPGDPPDPLTQKKLETAARGTTVNPRFKGAVTPPRPVLAFSELDAATLLNSLQMHIIYTMIGSVAAII